MPRLVIESGKFSGRSLELAKAAIIGRGETVELRIPDGKASREHCRVFQQGGGWVVVDLNSRNGIQVNGVKTTRKNLTDGDTILIGETVIAFRGSGAKAAPARAADAVDEIAVDEIEVDEIDVGGSGPVVQPVRPAPARAGPSQARKATAASEAKAAAFAAARASASGRPKAASGAPSKGVVVRDDVLQFNKIDASKASVFQTDLSQAGGMAPWLIWAAGLAFVALIMFLIIKAMGVTAG